jgi:uncharacterized protein YndB with AHSA1/START domain
MTERSVSHTTFVIERSYPAHPAKVFGAWSDAAAREIWMDDPDYKSDGSKYDLDFRVGGHEPGRHRKARGTSGTRLAVRQPRQVPRVPGQPLKG